MNSIIKAVSKSPDSFVSEIVLMIRSHRQDKKLLVVVEGKTDKKVYKSLLDIAKFDIYHSSKFGGCVQFDDAAKEISKRYPIHFIVIKDADFDNINRISYDDIPNLFLTDTHDLETMMLTSSAYMALKDKYGVDGILVRQAINEILHLSYLKWLNCKENYRLNFKKCCKVGTCYNGNCIVGASDWLEKINNEGINAGKVKITEEDLSIFEDSHVVSESEKMQITNGHDMLNAVAIKLHFSLKTNVGKKDIEDLLINTYTIEDFKHTKLCKDICAWVNQNFAETSK